MKVSELVRVLTKAGCFIHRHGANHDIWYSPKTGNKFADNQTDFSGIKTW